MTGFDFIVNFPREINLVEKIPAFVASLAQSKFQPVISTPGLIVYSASPNDQIVVNPAQYRFSLQRQIALDDLKDLLACIPNSLDALASDDADELIYILHMVEIRKAHEISALELTQKSAAHLLDKLPDSVGAGYRVLFKSKGLPGSYDEFKCEPWLRDPSFFFFERSTNYSYSTNRDVTGAAADAYPVFEAYISAAYDTLIEG